MLHLKYRIKLPYGTFVYGSHAYSEHSLSAFRKRRLESTIRKLVASANSMLTVLKIKYKKGLPYGALVYEATPT